MRNIHVIAPNKVIHSLSHWGMFAGDLHHENCYIIGGLDEYLRKSEETINIPVYHYRPMSSSDFDLANSPEHP